MSARAKAPGRAAITLLVLLPQLWIFQGGGWNQNSRFALARALVLRGSVRIDPDADCTGDKAERGGHIYSDKAPGVSFAAAAALALVGPAATALGVEDDHTLWWRAVPYFVTLLAISLPIALTAGALYAELLSLFGALAAALAVVAVFLASPIIGYSGLLYGHALAGCLLALGWLALRRGADDRVAPQRSLALAGLAAGAAIAVEYPAALGAVALALYAASFPTLRRALWAAPLGALPPLLLLALYQWAAFGNPLSPGYAHLAPTGFVGMSSGLFGIHLPRPQALWQLTFGVHRGLFRFSPALLLLVPGAVVLLHRNYWHTNHLVSATGPDLRREVLLALGLFAAFLALNAGYIYWDGHASFGPRHALPGVVLLIIPIAAAARRWPRLTAFLLLPSLAVCGLAWATHPEAAPLDWDPIRDNWLSLWSRDQIGASINWFNSKDSLDYRSGFSLPMLAGLDGRAALLPLIPLVGLLVFWWHRAVRAAAKAS